jgi:hypothetical protein
MDRNGGWRVKIVQSTHSKNSRLEWTLFDPNNNEAGHGSVKDEHKAEDEWFGYIESQNRPWAHSMPFGVTFYVKNPYTEDFRVQFLIEKEIPGCHWPNKDECKPHVQTESRTEKYEFEQGICEKECAAQNEKPPLQHGNYFWCDDLNKAEWFVMANVENGWMRQYECGWPGFDV